MHILMYMKCNKPKKVLSLFAGILVLSGCITKSAYSLSAEKDLNSYSYVSLKTLSDETIASDSLESGLADVFRTAGLTILGEDELKSADSSRSGLILLAEYDREEGSLESIVNLYFSDYATGEEVAFCRGTWGLRKADTNRRLSENNAVNQTRYLFGQGDELGEYNKYSWY